MNIFDLIRSTGWHPGIGDPTVMGWLVTVAYLIACAACAICFTRVEAMFQDHYPQHHLVWGMMAAGLFFLGLNKQLDLQSLFTAVGREIAYQQGWYDLHHRIQIIFVLGLAIIGLAALGLLGWWLRRVWRQYWLLLFGVLLLGRYVVVRAATFYRVPLPQLSTFTGGFRITPYLELIGAVCIIIAAVLNLRRGSKKRVVEQKAAAG